MGWSYRKSITLGPFRINVGKSGIGYSVGGRAFRTGVGANGRRYSSVSIPGTGLRYQRNVSPNSTGCLVVVLAVLNGLGIAGILLALIEK